MTDDGRETKRRWENERRKGLKAKGWKVKGER